ncbi:MAG: amidohydrolase [Clostridiales bacterium]|nr:amidohydrolase [Clostridiales bacterium]MBR5057332.1 amidohydrolase [Clostridiales bacterium]
MNKSVLFSDITIVTPHDGSPVSIQEHAYCSVSGNKIVYVGTSKEKAAEALKDSVEVFEYNGKNKILCPSFANAHGHTPMSIFRNIADDRSLQDWLFGQIIPREDKMVADDFYYGNLLTLAEMIEGGTACVANMYDGALLIAKGAVETGFRVQQTSMGKKCIDGKWSVDRASVDELNAFIEGEGKGLITHSLLVHSIYLYPEDFYKPLAELAKEYDLPVSVHISETITENENCQKSYGCSPVQKLDWAGLLNDRTVAAHCVHLTPEDRKILADRKVWVAHNPSSNMKLASGFADMVNMQKDGVRLCIGSDGAASNNNQDMYMEMRLASFMAKGTTLDPTVLKAEDVFTMATRNGYLACGFEDCGIIEQGMRADLQIVDYDCPQMWPLGNPLSALVYSCGPKCVESVMIDGQFVLFKHELKTIDMEKVKAETKKTMQRLQ